MDIFPGVPLGSTVSFQVYPSSIIGTIFTSCKMSAIYDYDTASKYIDVNGYHLNVFPFLPDGTPNDPTQYNYVKIDLVSGENEIIGVPWIIEDSVVVHKKGAITFTIEETAYEDIEKINRLLAANGYSAIDWMYKS